MSNIKLFETIKVRTQWDEKTEQWYFSIIDVIEILTDSKLPKRYWSDLKTKLKVEGSKVYEKIVRLKMLAEDGKIRETDVLFKKQSELLVIPLFKNFLLATTSLQFLIFEINPQRINTNCRPHRK